MPSPVTLTPVTTRGAQLSLADAPKAKVLKLYDMYEWKVTFDRRHFHLTNGDWKEFHNAYDADENGTMMRAEAICTHPKGTSVIPIYATKDRAGRWSWRLRLRPHVPGKWQLSVFAVRWHPDRRPGDPAAKKTRMYGATRVEYFEHVFGPTRLTTFAVVDREPVLDGPIETPDTKRGDNKNYFYRRGRDGKRAPFFLFGFARPWSTRTSTSGVPPERQWDAYLKRDTELFAPMVRAGCNTLYHWMAPGETNLVHQSGQECWAKSGSALGFFTNFPGTPLTGASSSLGYKRYDQGRAAMTDTIFDQAKVTTRSGCRTYVQLMVVVMPHSLLQARGHHWDEWAWKEHHPKNQYTPTGGSPQDVPCKLNGFHLFEKTPGSRLSRLDIDEFFDMKPGHGSWENRLWKHFANYWRYLFGRWTAHPALGAWVLMDELEGVGTDSSWWWDSARASRNAKWHDHLVRLVRGAAPLWGTAGGQPLGYVGDYLAHPITTSTTHYEGSFPGGYLPAGSHKRTVLSEFRRTGAADKALELIDTFADLPDRGDWDGNPTSGWTTDFVSHHAYQAVPYWGHWGYERDARTGRTSWNYWPNNTYPPPSGGKYGLVLPNEGDPTPLAANRWLWDSLCTRLRTWSRTNASRTKLITEYGCLERIDATTAWNHYGKRVPAFTHFASWAALVLGHAGVPFKWNDGAWFGDMAAHPGSATGTIWHRGKYPVDNLKQITNVGTFLERYRVDLSKMRPVEWTVVDAAGRTDTKMRAWALADTTRRVWIGWIHDRTFSTNGRATNRSIRITGMDPKLRYQPRWFDTWEALNVVSASGSTTRPRQPDASGVLLIPLQDFPTTTDGTIVGDGNDIALHLRAVSPSSA